MPADPDPSLAQTDPDKLVVAITARALFDLEDSHALFEADGLEAYAQFQRSREREVLGGYKRPVSATADSHEVRDVAEVVIRESRERTVTLLFDREHNLEERILNEQFIS